MFILKKRRHALTNAPRRLQYLPRTFSKNSNGDACRAEFPSKRSENCSNGSHVTPAQGEPLALSGYMGFERCGALALRRLILTAEYIRWAFLFNGLDISFNSDFN